MKKPITLLLTDTHLHSGNIPLVTDIWNQAIEKCLELNIKKISFTGDFFTSRKGQELAVDDAGRKIIDKVEQSGLEMDAIPGNHDKTDLESESSYLDEYSSRRNINIIRNYHWQGYDNDVILHYLPYFKENGSYPERLNKIIKNIIDLNNGDDLKKGSKVPEYKHILLTHIAVNGVRNNDGSKIDNDLSGTLFSHFYKVFTGHYHNKSFIEPNIHYFGSSCQTNFGEDDQKGFTILFDDGSDEFIQSKFPKYVKVVFDVNDEKAIKAAEKEHKNSDDKVRFVFEGEEADLKKINKEKLSSLGIEATFIKDSAVPLDNNGLLEKASNVSFDRSNIMDAFSTFCEMKHIEDRSVGEEYLKQI